MGLRFFSFSFLAEWGFCERRNNRHYLPEKSYWSRTSKLVIAFGKRLIDSITDFSFLFSSAFHNFDWPSKIERTLFASKRFIHRRAWPNCHGVLAHCLRQQGSNHALSLFVHGFKHIHLLKILNCPLNNESAWSTSASGTSFLL